MNGTQQSQSGSPVTTPQFPGKGMGGPHAQQQGLQRQVSSSARPHSVAFSGSTPMQVGSLAVLRLSLTHADSPQQAESSQGTTRDNTPPERKRQRRNSGSAAPSPYIQPQTLQPGFQQPPQPGMVMQQQMQMMPGGQQPQRVPINGSLEGQSPVQLPGQSPRNQPANGMPGQSMQRNQSKPGDGSMPPPQSPAGTSLNRKTPQGQQQQHSGVSAMTPKMQKDELIVSPCILFGNLLANLSATRRLRNRFATRQITTLLAHRRNRRTNRGRDKV